MVPIALGGGLGDLRFIMTTYNPEFIRVAVDELTAGGLRDGIVWLLTYPATAYALVSLALGLVAWSDRRLRPVAWLGLAWLLAAWVFALAGVRLYPHYFIATVPPLALLAGAGVSALARRSAAAGPVVAAVVVAGVCLPLAVGGWRSALEIPVAQRWMGRHVPALSPVADAARIVRGVTAPGDRIYVHTAPLYGGQTIYWLTGRPPADRLTYPGDMVPPRYDEVATRLAADPPTAIVMMPGAPQGGLDGAIAKGRMKVVARLPDGVGRELLVWSSRRLPEWLPAHAQAPETHHADPAAVLPRGERRHGHARADRLHRRRRARHRLRPRLPGLAQLLRGRAPHARARHALLHRVRQPHADQHRRHQRRSPRSCSPSPASRSGATSRCWPRCCRSACSARR